MLLHEYHNLHYLDSFDLIQIATIMLTEVVARSLSCLSLINEVDYNFTIIILLKVAIIPNLPHIQAETIRYLNDRLQIHCGSLIFI